MTVTFTAFLVLIALSTTPLQLQIIPHRMTKKKMVVRDGVAFCKKQSLPYFKVLYHPTPAACEEIKRTSTEGKERRQLWKASFVLRIEFGTTEFEAEVLTTLHSLVCDLASCSELQIKGPPSPLYNPTARNWCLEEGTKSELLHSFGKFGTSQRNS